MTCERCWDDAFVLTRTLGGSQVERYQELTAQRSGDVKESVICADYKKARPQETSS